MSDSAKKHICSVDKRQFNSVAALRQHERDSHGQGSPVAKVGNKKKKVKRAARGGRVSEVGLAQPMVVRNRTTDRATMSGTDRVAHVEKISNYEHSSFIIDKPINPAMFGRLTQVAEAFQKIQYLSLIFRIVPYVPATSSGGYVVSVVRDPVDTGPRGRNSETILAWLSSQQGSVSSKIWQSSTVQVAIPGVYFTSPGVEVREYCPGRLIVAVDGQSSQSGQLTVFAEWRVTLMHAALEPPVAITTSKQSLLALYTRAGHVGLFGKIGTQWTDDITKQIDGCEQGDVFELKYPFPFADANGALRVARWLRASSATDLVFCIESPDDTYLENCSTESLVLTAKTDLPVYKAEKVFRSPASELNTPLRPGNGLTGSLEDSMESLQTCLLRLTQGFEQFSRRLENSVLPQEKDESTSEDSFLLMDSPQK